MTTTTTQPTPTTSEERMSLTKRELIVLLEQQEIISSELNEQVSHLRDTVADQALRLTKAKRCYVQLREKARRYQERNRQLELSKGA